MRDIMTKAVFKESIFVTPHATDKACELFGIKNREHARSFIREGLRNSTFISEIVGDTGKVDRLFANKRIAYIVDRNDDVVITVYIREVVDKELRAEVKDIIAEHLQRIHATEKEIEEELLSLEIEYEINKEVSRRGIEPFASLKCIENRITALQDELDKFKSKRSRVAKGAVVFL